MNTPRAETTLKLTIQYDGTDFHGWQAQEGVRTVQGTIEVALESLFGFRAEVAGAGRTDRGVHAEGQVASVVGEWPVPLSRWAAAANGRLPPDVRIVAVERAPDSFHARFSAAGKHYRYRLLRGEVADCFRARYALHYPGPLDLDAMRAVARELEGSRDFAAFRSRSGRERPGDPPVRTVRTLDRIVLERLEDVLDVHVYGRSFLYKMVRTLVGSLLEVGRGRWSPGELARRVRSLERGQVGPTLPPRGLCLVEVRYPADDSGAGAGEGAR